MSEQNQFEEHRRFERFNLDFPVRIFGQSDDGESYSDDGEMQNVSGGGLCFETRHAEWYGVGKKVRVLVCMPGTDEIEANMECQARVMWMHFAEKTDAAGSRSALIGLCLDGFMSFETDALWRQRQPQVQKDEQ